MRLLLYSIFVFSAGALAFADDPKPVPATREEIKKMLEESKRSAPRLPLPPLTDSQKAADERMRSGQDQGPFAGVINNARMREYYLPAKVRGEFSKKPDPSMPLDPKFRAMLFWICSRANNCIYCLGHQESKLEAAGMGDDGRASLDVDWSRFDEAERAGLTFALKSTRQPQGIDATDIQALRKHFDELGTLDIIVSVAGFNAMNRWTGALAIPQEAHRVYSAPTSVRYRSKLGTVAPLDPAGSGRSSLACAAPARRPALESRAEVEAILEKSKRRVSRIRLVAPDQARALYGPDSFAGDLPAWACLLAHFPKAGKNRALSLRASMESGRLDAKLRAAIFWTAARNDRAWYALGLARRKLRSLGLDDDRIFALDLPDDSLAPGARAVLAFARKLTVDPALIGDDDFIPLRATFNHFEIAEIVHDITAAAFLDRLTEAAALPLEP